MHKPIIIKSGQDLPRKKKKEYRKGIQKFKEHWRRSIIIKNSMQYLVISSDKLEFVKLG